MNKIYKYKPGDKVIILKSTNGFQKDDIGIITKQNPDKGYEHCHIVEVKGKFGLSQYVPGVSCCQNDGFKYYYEKPLHNLLEKIIESHHLLTYISDYKIIKSFIELDITLTEIELKICKIIWDKYNKKMINDQ